MDILDKIKDRKAVADENKKRTQEWIQKCKAEIAQEDEDNRKRLQKLKQAKANLAFVTLNAEDRKGLEAELKTEIELCGDDYRLVRLQRRAEAKGTPIDGQQIVSVAMRNSTKAQRQQLKEYRNDNGYTINEKRQKALRIYIDRLERNGRIK